MLKRIIWGILAVVVIGVAGIYTLKFTSRGPAPLPHAATTGPNPTLQAPHPQIYPTIATAHAVGWPRGAMPSVAKGLALAPFATGLTHPRWLYVLPNGDVLAAEATTQTPKITGITSYVAANLQEDAGATGPNPNDIVLLRDTNGDGIADERNIFLKGLNQPYGMLLLGSTFYVANTDAVYAFAYTPGATSLKGPGKLIVKLPHHEPDNGHWTRNIVASPDGTKIFIAVGSSSNLADHGMAAEKRRANILEINPDGSGERIYASGLRNPNGMAFEPETGALWTVVNERDMLGDDLVPDYLTHVEEGDFYGWPYSYWGRHKDPRIAEKDQRPDRVARAIVPDYALGAHVAPLGLVFDTADTLPARYKGGAFVALHGSWNRSVRSGYKVVFVPFAKGKPAGRLEDVVTGFLNADGQAQGRPVGLVLDKSGALLIADDVGGAIWRVTAAR